MNAAGHRVEVVTGDIAEPGTADRLVQAVEQRRFPAGRSPAQRNGSGRRDRAEHVGFRREAGVHSEGHRQLAASSGHRSPGRRLVADILLGGLASRLARPGSVRRRELVGRRPCRLSALSWTSRRRDQLGPMGRGGACPVLRRSRRLDDHRRAGAGGDAVGARRRPGAYRCVQPRRPAVVPILPRRRRGRRCSRSCTTRQPSSGAAAARSVRNWTPSTRPNARAASHPRSPTRSARCCARPIRSTTTGRWSRLVSTR